MEFQLKKQLFFNFLLVGVGFISLKTLANSKTSDFLRSTQTVQNNISNIYGLYLPLRAPAADGVIHLTNVNPDTKKSGSDVYMYKQDPNNRPTNLKIIPTPGKINNNNEYPNYNINDANWGNGQFGFNNTPNNNNSNNNVGYSASAIAEPLQSYFSTYLLGRDSNNTMKNNSQNSNAQNAIPGGKLSKLSFGSNLETAAKQPKKSLEYMYKLKTDLQCNTRSANYNYKENVFMGNSDIELQSSGKSFDNKHLKYFGFYASSMEGAGTGNYLLETHQNMNANIVMIASMNFEYIKSKFAEAKKLGMKVIFSNQGFLFDEKLSARSDLTEWYKLLPLLKEYSMGEDPTLVAFYPFDEPYSHGTEHGVSYATMKINLEKAGAIMKQDFPEIPIAVIFSITELKNTGMELPRNYDWFSFDLYGCWSAANCDHGIIGLYEILGNKVAKLSDSESKKKMFVVADSYSSSQNPDMVFQFGVKDRAIHYYRLAQTNDCFVMYMPFIYQSFYDGSGYISGATKMPMVFEEYKNQSINWSKNLKGEIDIFKPRLNSEVEKIVTESGTENK